MRWLILKDLQILRRSPLLVGLLIVYPIAIAVLIGLALSGGPDKPKVAFANLVPPERDTISFGGEQLDAGRYSSALFESIDPIRVTSREEALAKVRSGEALGALIVPADLPERLQATINLGGGPPPTVEVLYNAEDPVKRRFVESTIESRLAEANQALSDRLTGVAAEYLKIIVDGGEFSLLGQTFDVLGLRRSETILRATIRSLPPDASERIALEQVVRFAGLASDNLDISGPILASIGEPVEVKQTIVEGGRTPLDAFAVAVSVTVSLMFVTLLLAAGMLALEREEHAFGRLVRGLVSRVALLAEKIALAALCSFAVTALMLAGLGVFVDLDWSRVPQWLAALALGALAFAAMGVAIGAVAREVRAASLLAFLLSLPIAFLALVPSGSVAQSLFDVISAISAVFPFKPALEALDAALNGGDLLGHLGHLAALTLAFGALARLSLRRFA
jgi:ABC-type transport system involved in cytochrome c biogenesis permease component